MWKFEIFTDKAGEYRFRLKASNGQIILASEWYKNKGGCENGIESVIKNSADEARFEKKETDAGFRFNLKSTNGQVIWTSQTYKSESARDNWIKSVSTNSAWAKIEEV